MAEQLDLTKLLKNKKGWVASLLSLVVGLGLGTTLGREVLDTAGIPASCVRTIQRADRAIDAGTSIADDSKAALGAVTDLRFGEAGDLLSNIPGAASRLFKQAGKFNTSRKQCNRDRE